METKQKNRRKGTPAFRSNAIALLQGYAAK